MTSPRRNHLKVEKSPGIHTHCNKDSLRAEEDELSGVMDRSILEGKDHRVSG